MKRKQPEQARIEACMNKDAVFASEIPCKRCKDATPKRYTMTGRCRKCAIESTIAGQKRKAYELKAVARKKKMMSASREMNK